MSQTHQVIVLRKEFSGESYLKLHLLGPELGRQLCLKRIATKSKSARAAPDLFDSAEVEIESSKRGTALFVNDYRVVTRRSEIGSNYRTLRFASDFSNLLIENGGHMADPEVLHQLAERSLEAFANRMEPSVVYLKSLYILLKDEGYPVRESWWASLAEHLKPATRKLLNEPSPIRLPEATRTVCEAAIEELERWLTSETDLKLPE